LELDLGVVVLPPAAAGDSPALGVSPATAVAETVEVASANARKGR
jgi:hypothetical protein